MKSSKLGTFLAGGLAFGIPLAFYLAFPNRNYETDAIDFLLGIRAGDSYSIFHPHHLIYNALGSVLYQSLRNLGIGVDTITLMQTVDSLAAATAVTIFFAILLRLSKKVTASLLFALLLAFSMAVWEYAIEVEVYTCGLVFLMVSLLLMANSLSQGAEPRPGTLVALGVFGGLACLFHQMHILLVPVVCTFIYFVGKGLFPKLKMAILYLVPLTVLVGGSYAGVGYALDKLPSVTSFYNWLTSYFHSGGWGHLSLQSFPMAAYGLQKSFFRASFLRDFFLTGNIDAKGTVLLCFFGLGMMLLVVLIVISMLKLKDIHRSGSQLLILLLVWIMVYGGFVFWWYPLIHELWMHILPPF